MFRYDVWVWMDTAVIVAVLTLIGAVIQFIIAPILEERRRAKKKSAAETQRANVES